MTNEQKFNLAQAREMINYNSQRIQTIREEIERLGYDIRLLQMQIRSMKGEQIDAKEKANNSYY